MIAKKISMKNVRLSNFAELVSYLSTSQGIHNRVGKVEMHNFNDINDLNFAVYDALRVQDYNKTAKSDKTYHLLVSFANGEDLSDEQLTKIEQSMIDALGFTEHQRISVVHRDTDNLHFHVAINKIHPEKFTIHEPHRDFKILGEQCKKFEIEFSLKQLERGKGNKLGIDMEEMSGLESMIGWARRNVSESIKNAQSWEQVNQILNEHGLDLKKRGNGFVIGNGEIFVKASSIDREFSKAKLETKLGTYPYDKNGDVTYPKKTEYKKKPYSKRDTSQLYAEYQQSRSEFEEQRNYEINTLKLAKNKEISDIKAKFNLRFALAKATKGQSKRFLMKVLILQMRAEIKNSQKKYKGESQKIYKNYKNRTWADWLKKEAISGNERALQALRGRGKEAVYKGNQFKGEQVDNFENLRIDTVTKKGTVIYEQDNYTIRDTGKSLRLGAIPEPKAVEKALEIAIKKYGKRLDISGTKEFQEKVAKIAAAKGLDVEFSNPVINNHLINTKRSMNMPGQNHEELSQLMELGAVLNEETTQASISETNLDPDQNQTDTVEMSPEEMAASMEQYSQEKLRSSPTLESLELEKSNKLPEEVTVCEECPNAVWFSSKDELKCYCRVMFLITWASKDPQTIQLCDGQYIGQEES